MKSALQRAGWGLAVAGAALVLLSFTWEDSGGGMAAMGVWFFVAPPLIGGGLFLAAIAGLMK